MHVCMYLCVVQEEVDVLLQTVTDGRSQLELAEEKMLRMKRRYEKRIKILENDLDDARDVSTIMIDAY